MGIYEVLSGGKAFAQSNLAWLIYKLINETDEVFQLIVEMLEEIRTNLPQVEVYMENIDDHESLRQLCCEGTLASLPHRFRLNVSENLARNTSYSRVCLSGNCLLSKEPL